MRVRNIMRAAWIGITLIMVGALAVPARAKWMAPTQIPVARLLKSTIEYVNAHRGDARGYYMLGRINSAAFALDAESIGVYPSDPLPTFPGYAESPVQTRTAAKPISASALKYYSDAVRNYRKATELDPKSAIAWLGAGFECEEGLLPFDCYSSHRNSRLAWQAGHRGAAGRGLALLSPVVRSGSRS